MCTLPTISMVYIGGYRGVAVLYVVVVSDTRARSPCRSCRAMGRGKWKSSDDDEGVRCFRAIVPTSAFERNWANTLDRKRSHSLSLSFTFLRHTLSLSPSFNHSLSHTHYLSLSLSHFKTLSLSLSHSEVESMSKRDRRRWTVFYFFSVWRYYKCTKRTTLGIVQPLSHTQKSFTLTAKVPTGSLL